MGLLVAMLLQGAVHSDGLPTYTAEQMDAARATWGKCLREQADRAALLTNDPSNVVADVAIELCSTDESNARFAWRRYIIVASKDGLNDDQAKASADKYFDQQVADYRRFLLGRVSQTRQIKALEK